MIMSRTYIKPNSHSQRSATEMIETMRQILCLTGMSKDEWVTNLFELGCEWSDEKDYDLDILINPDLGYWPQWINAFLSDDAALLATCEPSYLQQHYRLLKQEMVRPIKLPEQSRGSTPVTA